jgi:hypothetical protein
VKRSGGFAMQSIKIKPFLFILLYSLLSQNNPSVSLRSTPPFRGRQGKPAETDRGLHSKQRSEKKLKNRITYKEM